MQSLYTKRIKFNLVAQMILNQNITLFLSQYENKYNTIEILRQSSAIICVTFYYANSL